MSEPESTPQRIGTFRPPVIGAMLADSIGVKRLQESIALSVAKTAAPFADMHAKLAAQIGADVFASFGSAIKFPTVTATMEPFSAQANAAIAAMFARALPTVEPIPAELFVALRRPPMAALADRFEDALDRTTTVMVSTITTSVAPVASDVARIARPRGWSLGVTIIVVVASFVAILGGIFEMLSFLR